MQLFLTTLLIAAVSSISTAQSRPRSITGTYSVSWKYEAGCSLEVEQLADSTRIHFAVDCNRGAPSYNMGSAEDTAVVARNVAVWQTTEFSGEMCELRMKFTDRLVTVKQSGSDADCGFGFHVYASGTYKRVSRAKPRFDHPH